MIKKVFISIYLLNDYKLVFDVQKNKSFYPFAVFISF